jgi:hypothetical protein
MVSGIQFSHVQLRCSSYREITLEQLVVESEVARHDVISDHHHVKEIEMSKLPVLALALTQFCFIVSAVTADTNKDSEQLFNGKDLSNWTWVTDKKDSKLEDVWSVKDRVLHCTGNPRGYIRTKKDDYQNYSVTVEWRWPGKGGNNGVLVHTSTPSALGVWPKSIEVQLAHGNAGDFWVIGTDLDVPNEETRKKGRRHLNLTDDSEKPIGEWNRMEITCQGDEIVVKVNGDTVNHAENCSVSRGAISLQSEGTSIEFRMVELKRLQSPK